MDHQKSSHAAPVPSGSPAAQFHAKYRDTCFMWLILIRGTIRLIIIEMQLTESRSEAMSGQGDREAYLDSARGIAAVTVLAGHLACCYGLPPCLVAVTQTPLRGLWNGRAAVEFFFILSGFVLSAPFFRKERPADYPSIPGYALRRMFRIYPAFWGALLLAGLAKWIASLAPLPSTMLMPLGWWSPDWKVPTSFNRLLQEAYLIWRPDDHRILNQDWTLWIELTFSLFVPSMAVLCRRQIVGFFLLAACAVLCLGVSPVILSFAVGVLIARVRGGWCEWWQRQPLLVKIAFFLLGTLFYSYETNLHPSQVAYALRILGNPETVGAAMILLSLLASRRLQRVLQVRPLLALGHLSYGLYLVHGLVILTVLPMVIHGAEACGVANPTAAWFICLFVAVAVSALIAWPLWKWIEMPANRLGKRWASQLEKAPSSLFGALGRSAKVVANSAPTFRVQTGSAANQPAGTLSSMPSDPQA